MSGVTLYGGVWRQGCRQRACTWMYAFWRPPESVIALVVREPLTPPAAPRRPHLAGRTPSRQPNEPMPIDNERGHALRGRLAAGMPPASLYMDVRFLASPGKRDRARCPRTVNPAGRTSPAAPRRPHLAGRTVPSIIRRSRDYGQPVTAAGSESRPPEFSPALHR